MSDAAEQIDISAEVRAVIAREREVAGAIEAGALIAANAKTCRYDADLLEALLAERDAALARMADLEAAARHNSDWARDAIAAKEAVEKERDALQAEVARLTEWDAASRIEALVEEVDALRAEHAQIEAAMPEVVHAMADLCDDYIKDIPELAERLAAIRAVLPMPDTKGTPNAD
jgi:hypothetical protein